MVEQASTRRQCRNNRDHGPIQERGRVGATGKRGKEYRDPMDGGDRQPPLATYRLAIAALQGAIRNEDDLVELLPVDPPASRRAAAGHAIEVHELVFRLRKGSLAQAGQTITAYLVSEGCGSSSNWCWTLRLVAGQVKTKLAIAGI